MKPNYFAALIFLVLLILGNNQNGYCVASDKNKAYSEDEVDILPTFQGKSVKEFDKWLGQRLSFPKVDNDLDTTLKISFIVEKNGSASNIKVEGSPTEYLAKQIVTQITNSKDWQSGKIGNKSVRTQIKTNINIHLKLRKLIEDRDPKDSTGFNFPEIMPSFMGGDLKTFSEWVTSNIRVPNDALKNKIPGGRVSATFVVDKDGSIGDIEILKSPDDCYSAEVIRVLESSPKWKPAIKDSKPVRVRFTMPINFTYR